MKSAAKQFFSRLFSTKRPFKLTRPGWVFILYSIGVGAGAINTGNNLLYIVFGIFLGLLLASGVLSDLSLWGLEVSWVFPSVLRAEERADVWLTVTNTKRWWPSLGVSIVLEGVVGADVVRFSAYAPCVRKRESLSLPAAWIPPKRGEFVLREVRVSTRYPFGLLEKWWRVFRGTPAVSVLIQPRRVNVPGELLWDFSLGDHETSARQALREGVSSSAVRDYRTGDNPRRIHWKISAKRGATADPARPGWLVRQMDPEQQHRVILEWPAPPTITVPDSELESLIAFAASLRDALLERDWGVDFVLSENRVLEEQRFLALWDPHTPWTRGLAARWDRSDGRRINLQSLFLRVGAPKAA